MSVCEPHPATDGQQRSMDWTTLGARVRQAARMAAAVHLAERSRRQHAGRPELRLLIPDGDELEAKPR